MFGGAEPVETEPQICRAGEVVDPKTNLVTKRGCPSDTFWLYDLGAGAQGTQTFAMKCTQCQGNTLRKVVPAMNPEAGADAGDIEFPRGWPQPPDQRQMLCGARVKPHPKTAPLGQCLMSRFRVFEKGNDLFSRCTTCGHGDELGTMGAAVTP